MNIGHVTYRADGGRVAKMFVCLLLLSAGLVHE